MAYSAWASSTAYAVGDIVRASSVQASGLAFCCTVAGTSATTEPAWPTDIGSTSTDNTVTWQAISSVYAELSTLAPSAIIELFELTLDFALHGDSSTFRWHNGCNADVTGDIVWSGNSYVRLPVKAEGFEYSNTGTLPRPTLTISNLDGNVSALLLLVNTTTPGNDLGGATVKRIRTLKKYLDGQPGADPHAKFPDEIWYVDRKAGETRDSVSFELASKFDLAGVMLPKRQIIANICQWKYRSTECGYTGNSYYNVNDEPVNTLAEDKCGKRIDSCAARFQAFTQTGSVVTGSNLLTLTSPIIIGTGTPVSGFGIPANTTVSSVSTNGLVVTLSQSATATTTATKTGTIQSNRTQLIVSNTTGLANGMAISGPNIAAGTTISGIVGTTITLSQPAAKVYTLFASRSGKITSTTTLFSPIPTGTSNKLYVTTTGLTTGMFVMGQDLPTNYTVTITAVATGIATLSYTTKVSVTNTTYNFYTLGTYSSQTYAFSSNTTYTFRDASNDALPFGSFPGAGLIQ